ncbi:MAG: hypothetical protein ACT4TC_20725 [Myxococcaceae bacterium]
MDLVFDPGVALAAGLNSIPKSTFLSQYSSRLGRKAIADLLGTWVQRLKTEKLIDASSFNLDFHSISYFGEDPFVEKHYVPRRSQRRKAVLAFFAQDADGQVFCYSNADIRKGEEADEVLRFVEFWKTRYGELVQLSRRAHNPILIDAGLISQPTPIPCGVAAICESRSPDCPQ